MSIQVRNLSKKYNTQTAVDGISFEIPSGQVVGFLGPNGAGKSTTMKILTGFISPSQGDAQVCEINVGEDPTKAQSMIGYLPEHNPLYLEMYVKEYLHFMGKLSGIKKGISEKVDDIIALTGLTQESGKKIGELSKGFRQRVGLAQALIHDPQVLILDEPTSGLDPNQVGEIRRLIRDIGKNRTVMLSTHIMQEVEAMCDRVIIINKGIIVADDTVKNLQRKHKDKNVIVAFKKTVRIKKLGAIKGIKKVGEMGNNTFRITTGVNEDIQEALFHFAVESSNVIIEQKEEQQSLEHIFKAYTT